MLSSLSSTIITVFGISHHGARRAAYPDFGQRTLAPIHYESANKDDFRDQYARATRGYACEASMAGHRAAMGLAYPQAQAGGQDPRADRPKSFTAQRWCRRR